MGAECGTANGFLKNKVLIEKCYFDNNHFMPFTILITLRFKLSLYPAAAHHAKFPEDNLCVRHYDLINKMAKLNFRAKREHNDNELKLSRLEKMA